MNVKWGDNHSHAYATRPAHEHEVGVGGQCGYGSPKSE